MPAAELEVCRRLVRPPCMRLTGPDGCLPSMAPPAVLQTWADARQAKDWSAFAPVLQEWVDLAREQAAAIDSTR